MHWLELVARIQHDLTQVAWRSDPRNRRLVNHLFGEGMSPKLRAMRSGLDLDESGLERLVRAAYGLLDLITFFTAHRGVEARARALRRGRTAWDAAGKVHTDIQARFARAEVIGWRELVDAGGYAEARERGLLRVEGRDYVVEDGDVITIRH